MRLGRYLPPAVRKRLRHRYRRALLRALGPDAPKTPKTPKAPTQQPVAIVESFSRTRVIGWVNVPASTPPVRVSLRVDDLEVATTWATDAPEPENPDSIRRNSRLELRPFYFEVKGIWDYAARRSPVSVTINGKRVPIAGHGMFVRNTKAASKSLDELREAFAQGYVFSHSGQLQLSKKFDKTWQSHVMGLYDNVREAVHDKFGYDPFVIYGTLLGAVRENGYIGHDMDFDLAYLSSHTDPISAKKELEQVALHLIECGFDVHTKWTALHIHHPDDPATRVDLFHVYFDTRGELCFPFGVAGTSSFRREQWRGLHEIDLAGSRVCAPVAAEELVESIYGIGWRQPKPGFNWTRDRTRRASEGQLSTELRENAYWSNYYAHNGYTEGSTFCAAVSERPDTPHRIIDIGCGQGRDSLAFAAAGRQIVGLDRSPVGVRIANEQAVTLGLDARVRFEVCDVSDEATTTEVLGRAIAMAGNEPVLFYLRFFLHSIPEDVQNSLIAVISRSARQGDMFAAEFRTDKDESAEKVHGQHYRRFQNGPAFGAKLDADAGFELLEETEGTGLSPYRGEDPELYRVLARKR